MPQVVGDNSGSITCFSMKKGEAITSFKTPSTGKEVAALSLGGGGKGENFIFSASGTTVGPAAPAAHRTSLSVCGVLSSSVHRQVKGIKRKGGEFYSFQTPHTEELRGLQARSSIFSRDWLPVRAKRTREVPRELTPS